MEPSCRRINRRRRQILDALSFEALELASSGSPGRKRRKQYVSSIFNECSNSPRDLLGPCPAKPTNLKVFSCSQFFLWRKISICMKSQDFKRNVLFRLVPEWITHCSTFPISPPRGRRLLKLNRPPLHKSRQSPGTSGLLPGAAD